MRLLAAAVATFASVAFTQDWANPVIPGDHPDPSVVRVGEDYYATATSSGWAPIFPVFHSRDLKKWEQIGSMFERRPEWSVSNYWAPEIMHYHGRFYVYYTARKLNGPLCVGVATADEAAGPWEDHGPLVCDPDGSIDPMAVDDEHGRRYLIWKEDGNSQRKPTPIWAQPLEDDGLRLTGKRTELIRNTAPWEGAVVEGPFILRRNGFFYLFYAGGACCGTACNYAEGVARSRNLLGPYEKDPANPILKADRAWKCPGHGSLTVDPRGRTFFLYHAYPARDSVYVGREALLDEVTWNSQGWPEVDAGCGPSQIARPPEPDFADYFRASRLQPGWQWPPDNEPRIRTGAGSLLLSPAHDGSGDLTAAVVAQSPTHADYVAVTSVGTGLLAPGVAAGIAGYGNEQNALGLAATRDSIVLWRREKGATSIVQWTPIPSSATTQLRMTVAGGRRFSFAWSPDGRSWNGVRTDLEGDYLPPWDMSARIALTASGPAAFQFLVVKGPARATIAVGVPPSPPADVPSASAPLTGRQPARPRLNPGDFIEAPKQYRPWTVWWWFGSASNERDLVRELAEMDSHGIGGVEINCVYPLDLPEPLRPDTVEMYSNAWKSRFEAVLREAARRNMKVWLRGGSGWPYGGPWIGRDLSARAVAMGSVDVRGPSKFAIPKPKAPYEWTVDAIERLVAVNADTAERRVLEEAVAPAGQWRVYAIYRMFTNQTVKRAAPGGGGLVLDHFSARALDEQLKPLQSLLPIIGRYPGAFAGVTSDSLELDDSNWTTDMLSEFEKRRGYDLSPWLPDLWKRVSGDSDGVRQDFLQTLSELQIERYFRHLQDWAKRNGFGASVQAHGGIADALEGYGSVAVPDGETIWPGQDRYQVNLRNRVLAASAARIYGRPVVSAESYTWLRMPRFLVTLGTMKAASDAIYLDGINQIKNHGYPSSPEIAGSPGWAFYASTMINHNQTWWPHYPALSAYVTRMNYLMQAGDRVAGIAIYSNLPDARAHFDDPKKSNAAFDAQDDAWGRRQDPGLDTSALIAMEVGDCADRLRRAGYGFDVVNDEAIRRGLSGYRVLVFYRTRSVLPETLRALDVFRKRGGIVLAVGQLPEQGVGLLRRAEQRVDVERLRGAIRLLAGLDELQAALDKSIGPDFRSTEPLGSLHRISEGVHYYFVANGSDQTVTAQLSFRPAVRAVQQWNPVDGSIGPAHNPVTLGPFESTVFVFPREPGPGYAPPEAPPDSRTLDLKWTVSFPNRTFEWSRLQNWINVPELQSFSGIATYESEFEAPPDAREVAIELGDVRSSAELFVNGQSAGIAFLPPYRVDLKDLWHPGRNQIEVRVANLWSNYIRALPRAPSKLAGPGYSLTDILYGPSDRPLLSSGLLGPVRLLWR